jgi:ATP adenylyltransferase
MKKVVNKRFAVGKGEYENVIDSIEKTGLCPFCPENFKYHKKKLIEECGNWFLTENSWPYKNTKYHFIIISKKHKENFSDLSKKDFEDVKELVNFAIKKFDIKGGALSLRFGDTDYTGATVCHLHFHIISPELDENSKSKTVYFPIG